MLKILCQDRLDAAKAFAERVGAGDRLQRMLDYLANFGGTPEMYEARLYGDHAAFSFGFSLHPLRDGKPGDAMIAGGVIYSGPGQALDGSAPALTVSLTQSRHQHDWSCHT